MRALHQHTSQRGIIAAVALLMPACCHYPVAQVKKPMISPPAAADAITLVVYGDTRTGPWGTGDNAQEAIHGAIVSDVFQNAGGPIDAAIFTGDAVMSNFPAWKKDYWRCFLKSANRFQAAGIPFYPALGNHEVLPAIVPLIEVKQPIRPTSAVARPREDQKRAVAEAYEAGEEPPSVPATAVGSARQLDPNTGAGKSELKQWQKRIQKGDTASAYQLGQFEHQVQKAFYSRGNDDDRCKADADAFAQDYLTLAKYKYLQPLLNGRSYYSKVIEKNSIRVKVIALDTNCLNSQPQQMFFKEECGNFDGPIIIFGHHPPVDYSHPSWAWDTVPGWDDLKPYFSNTEGHKIKLWVFGHVHDYQRRGKTTGTTSEPPILLGVGGGGASLDASPPSFQWQPDSWAPPISISQYSHAKVTIRASAVQVEVRGTESLSKAFQPIDSFSFPIGRQNQ